MKVLVTGAGALLGQGIIKSLRLAPTRYEIVAVDPDPRAVGLYWADQAYLVPLADDPCYLERILELIEIELPQALLVGTDVELMVFAKHRPQIESTYGVKIVVSSPEMIRTADDKWLTYQFLVSNGFPHPRSALPNGKSELLKQCPFPLVVKPRTGARSVGVRSVRNENELELALEQVNDPIIQESVATADEEYTSGVLTVDGDARTVVTMRRELRDGNTYRAYVEPDAPFNPLLAKIAERLGGYGPINLQFRLENGVPKIFEINARFSGTTPVRAYAGFNEVDAVIRYCVDGEPIQQPALRPIVVLRYWDEIVIQPHQVEMPSDDGRVADLGFERPASL